MATIVGSASAAAASVAIPAHQPGDMIVIIARRASFSPPTTPAAGGTVPTWVGIFDNAGDPSPTLSVRMAIATASDHTSGTWTNAQNIAAVVLRPKPEGTLSVGAISLWQTAQNIIFPAITLRNTDGTSYGLRCAATSGTAEQSATTGAWQNLLVQPAGANAVMTIKHLPSISPGPDTAVWNSIPAIGNTASATLEIADPPLNQMMGVV